MSEKKGGENKFSLQFLRRGYESTEICSLTDMKTYKRISKRSRRIQRE